uniref:F-box domain-containing protein n=2 Tax=Cyprinus carpio TaxID=7962 RepID=A0A8C1Q8D7_CYPCA
MQISNLHGGWILLNLPAHQVVRVCRLVCREWKELVDSAAHWREHDWRLVYFKTKKGCNLLKNSRADGKIFFYFWENYPLKA